MVKILLIAGGGAVGAVCRYLVSGWAQRYSDVFPIGTLSVNMIGCLLIGILAALFAGPSLVREEYRFAIMIGLLGAFTTFSTFSLETFQLLNSNQIKLAVMNVVLSNALGFLLAWFGYRVGEKIFGV